MFSSLVASLTPTIACTVYMTPRPCFWLSASRCISGFQSASHLDGCAVSSQDALISNIGRRDTATSAADPTQPWLELDVFESPSVKQDACSWNEHVGTVDIEVVPRATMSGGSASGGGLMPKFHIFVDGQPYGPFSKARECIPHERSFRALLCSASDPLDVLCRFVVVH